MGFFDKLKNRSERAKGRAKESVGRDHRDPYLKAEGKTDRYKAGVKQVGEHAKDAVREVRKTTRH